MCWSWVTSCWIVIGLAKSIAFLLRLRFPWCGSRGAKKTRRLKPTDLTNILRNLATLVGNGVPLPKALNGDFRKMFFGTEPEQVEITVER